MADERTIEAYATRVDEFAAAYNAVRPPFLSRLGELIAPGGRVLDVGSGSGRDLAALAEEGFEAWGVEPVAAFRTRAERDFPALKGRIRDGALPDRIPAELGAFDAIHCAAVLMHLPAEELFNAVLTIRELLRPGGVAHFSYCPDRPDLDAHNRSPGGRLYNPINPSQLVAILSRAGFEKVSEETAGDAMGRAGIRWVSLIVRRVDESTQRPLQRIERIVNHDNKDASCKLALLRALAEAIEATALRRQAERWSA